MTDIRTSISVILNEFKNLQQYLSQADIINGIKDFGLNDFHYCTYMMYGIFFVLLIYFYDNVTTHWNNIYHKTNKYNTKKYNNLAFLFLYETIKYITQLPNLITLIVGIIQCVYASKFINIGVTISCWAFAIFGQLIKFLNAEKSDEKINSYIVKSNNKEIRADIVKINDDVNLQHNDKTAAFIKVSQIKYDNKDKKLSDDQLKDFDIGFYDDKESTGEDISKSFSVGDIIPSHRLMCRPDLTVKGKIIKYVEPVIFEHQVTTPIYLDNVRFFIDIMTITLLCVISLFISASANAHISEYNMSDILKHIIATMIAGNVLIPSMRMTLLYNVYNMILSLSFISIKINSYEALPKMNKINSIVFDKTGTLTEEYLMTHNHYSYSNHSSIVVLKQSGWSDDEISFGLAMANSESNILDGGKAWGTSPEENKILEYWFINKNVELIFNPVKSSGSVIFKFPNSVQREIEIKTRHPYNFELGKISSVTFVTENKNIEFIIRQHGTSRFIGDHYNNMRHSKSSEMLHSIQSQETATFDWAYQITKMDKRRSMAIAICTGDELWEILSIYTFENPLRQRIPDVITFFRNNHLPCSILTGDGRETAEDIAKDCGFPETIIVIKDEYNMTEALKLADKHKISISIEGTLLNNMLNETENIAERVLNNNNIFKIIYKASKNVKEFVVNNTNNCLYVGDAKNDELAIKSAYVGIALSHGAETCKLYADICIKQPLDLIDILAPNGYSDMLLVGGQKIFRDVCFIGGMICGCLMVGIHYNNFEFLNHSLLYKDVWNPLPMLMISSVQYTTSIIGYASSNCNKKYMMGSLTLSITAIFNTLIGLIIGISLSWIIKNWIGLFDFQTVILHVINLVILIKHSIHCVCRQSLFGNQFISNSNKNMGFSLTIIDSIVVRLLLYILYTILF